MNTSMIVSFLVLLLGFSYVFATDYTVGDANQWTQGIDYTTWTSGKTFKVGDNLVFKYGGTHQVNEVSESDYKSCSSSNTIKNYADGDSKVPLTKAGKIYFICPTPGHCTGGMKLEVNVVAASTTPTPSATPPTAKTPSKTPSPTPSKAPSATPSKAPSPTPSKAPSATPSTSPSTTPSPTPSTSPSTPPSATPSTSPSTTPSATPSTSPSTPSSETNSTSPSSPPNGAVTVSNGVGILMGSLVLVLGFMC